MPIEQKASGRYSVLQNSCTPERPFHSTILGTLNSSSSRAGALAITRS